MDSGGAHRRRAKIIHPQTGCLDQSGSLREDPDSTQHESVSVVVNAIANLSQMSSWTTDLSPNSFTVDSVAKPVLFTDPPIQMYWKTLATELGANSFVTLNSCLDLDPALLDSEEQAPQFTNHGFVPVHLWATRAYFELVMVNHCSRVGLCRYATMNGSDCHRSCG